MIDTPPFSTRVHSPRKFPLHSPGPVVLVQVVYVSPVAPPIMPLESQLTGDLVSLCVPAGLRIVVGSSNRKPVILEGLQPDVQMPPVVAIAVTVSPVTPRVRINDAPCTTDLSGYTQKTKQGLGAPLA